uniref:C2 domain-containing protein n=1 Tax=Parastrongyloides trichosuri TaxID=131310 RepID=A0A0N5A400_PARTI
MNKRESFLRPKQSFNETTQQQSQVMVTISAKNIRDDATDAVPDPYCIVSLSESGGCKRGYQEIGKTEVIWNCLNPEWSTKIKLDYKFSERQRLMFEVYDKTRPKKRLGCCQLLLHEIVGAKYNRITTHLLEDGKRYGEITVIAEELSKGRQESVYFIVSATKLDRKDFLGKCDPFLKISRINYDDTLHLAYRSRYHEQNLNPKWKPFEIHINQLCYGDKNREFLIECYDWDQDGNHDLVGQCKTTVNRMVTGQDKLIPLIHPKKVKKSKKYVNSGILHLHKVYCWMDYTFLDFITGGTQLDYHVVVDFTHSNLPMEDQSSLHRIDPDEPNQYEIAIAAIAETCQHYNRSKIFNGYGFGARLPGDNKVHYNFPLNLETNNPRCYGIEGLLEAYMIAQSQVELSGPTNFAPTIRFAARQAAMIPNDGSRYCVVLIITDGVISDMEKTKEEIIKASSLPLSIIIVGVGYDSFEEMKELDSDKVMLNFNGKYAKRDIVQFVQLRNFLPPHRVMTEEERSTAKEALAREVLEEVPEQLTSYMKTKGIFPREPDNPFIEENSPPSESFNMEFENAESETSCNTTPVLSPKVAMMSTPQQSETFYRQRRLLPQAPDEEFDALIIN